MEQKKGTLSRLSVASVLVVVMGGKLDRPKRVKLQFNAVKLSVRRQTEQPRFKGEAYLKE